MTSRSVARSTRILTFAQVQQRMGAILEVLARIPLNAWDRYRNDFAPGMPNPPSQLRSATMQALMVAEADKMFGGSMVRRNGRALFCATEGVVVQFKKLGANGLPMNYPTPTALAFAAQLDLPGMPMGVRLTLGYRLTPDSTAVAEVRLVLQDAAGIVWSEEITVNQTVMPLRSEIPAATRRRLQAKGTVAKKRRKTGE